MHARTLVDLVAQLNNLGDRELFRHQAEFRTFSWSYLRVARAARRVAAYLQRRGVAPGERVMIWGSNTPEWAVVFLGCFFSGVVPVPIDLRSRASFLQEVRRQTEARLLFATRLKPDPELGIPIVPLEGLEESLQGVDPEQFEPVQVAEDDLVEILYTSGTTADPKGVMLTHRNLLSELEAFQPVVPPEPEYRFLSVLPLSHILEQMGGLLLPISRGGTVIYIGTVRPSALQRALEREHPNVMMVVPRLLELLRDRVLRQFGSHRVMSKLYPRLLDLAPRLPFELRRWLFWPVHQRLGGHLKYLVSGGAALPPEMERFWDSMGTTLLQGYGLTETASAVSCTRVDARRLGSVGKVLSNQEVRLAPDGEILVRGPNVTRGYYGRPDLTQESFEEGWLKTGDLGQSDQDGYLFIRGRKKELIVTSAGINVYPRDVEEALARMAGVRDSAVVEWQGEIHAVLLLEEGVDPHRVVQEANEQLDSSQKIQGYTVWPEPDFPRTLTMKPRKQSLLDYLRKREAGGEAAALEEAGATPSQRLVAEVAGSAPTKVKESSALGVDLGMGSIELLDLVSRFEEELGVDLPEEEVTAETRVADLERLVERGEEEVARASFPWWSLSPIVRAARQVLQQLLLFPALRLFSPPRVEGLENLRGLSGPHLLAANHTSLLDTPMILMALPKELRQRTATAAWAEYFEGVGLPLTRRILRRLEYYLAAALMGIFPLPQTRLFRPSLRYEGELVELGWNVLIFPEGARTRTGEIGPFKQGVGVMASQLRLPIVPVKVEGLFGMLPEGKGLRRPKSVTVRFGRPLTFRSTTSYLEISHSIEEAVRRL